MAFYQNLAENGSEILGGATLSGFRGFSGPLGELQLPPADGLILRSVTIGTAASFLIRLDPSIADEATGARDAALDMYDRQHGFDPETGHAAYGETFLNAYYRQQAIRMNGLIARAELALEAIEEGTGRFSDDDFVVIPGTRANPTTIDLTLASITREPYPAYPSGTTGLVPDTRRVNVEFEQNRSINGAAVHRIRPMLSYRLIRVDPDRFNPHAVTAAASGIDFASSNSSTPTNLRHVSAPLLLIQGTGDESNSVKLPTAELNYDAAASLDKSLIFVEGATHAMLPVAPEFGDTRGTAADLMAGWLQARFDGR